MASLFGLFIFSCAVEHHLHWVYDHGHPQAKSVALLFIGWVEAGTALLTAILVLLGAVIWGVRKWTDK